MQVTFSPFVNNKQIQTKNGFLDKQINECKNIKELQKHSLSEVLGRVQAISFKGINTVEGDYVEHTCEEKTTSHGKIIEHIIYNKKSGNYTHRITDKDGGVISSEEYNPSQQKEVITTYTNNIATITTTTPTIKTIEKLDDYNRRIYFEEIIGDTVKTEETDYNRGRTVITHKVNGSSVQPTKVIDLSTGEPVTEGSLVVDTFFDETNREYTTKNIVTGRVHKKEKIDEQGKPVYTIEYNPETGLIVKDKRYGSEYTEDTFTGEEPNRLISSLFVLNDGREKEIIHWAEDGETVASHTKFVYRKDGSLEEEVKFNSSQVVTEQILYGKGESRTHHFYDEETCLKKSTKEYDKKGRFVSETLYYEDGKKPKAKKEVNKDKSFTIISYNREQVETRRNNYDSQKKLLSTEIYNVETNSLEKTIDYDLETGNRTITLYDEEYETPLNETITDKDGTILSQTVFLKMEKLHIIEENMQKTVLIQIMFLMKKENLLVQKNTILMEQGKIKKRTK